MGKVRVADPEEEATPRVSASSDALTDPLAGSTLASAPGDSLQLDAAGVSSTGVDAHETASSGLSGTGGPLPHLDRIQASFGHHDVGGVRAHTDESAQQATTDLNARGFALGSQVALGRNDLFTAAHEAAHTVQQAGGLSLLGKRGREGDAHERHADAVAAKVIAGTSAEGLLDVYTGGQPSSVASTRAGGMQQMSGSGPLQLLGSAGYDKSKNSASTKPKQLKGAALRALLDAKTKKGQDRLKKLGGSEQDVEETGAAEGGEQEALPAPAPVTRVQTQGTLQYEHTAKLQGGAGSKLIEVLTVVHLIKADDFEDYAPDDMVGRAERQRTDKASKANDESSLMVGSFSNLYRVKGGKVTEMKAGTNVKTAVAREGGRDFNMTDVTTHQMLMAVEFKRAHVHGLRAYRSARGAIDTNSEPPEASAAPAGGGRLTILREPAPATDTAELAGQYQLGRLPMESFRDAMMGTTHATVPYHLALQGGLSADDVQVELASGNLLFTLNFPG